MSRSIGDDLATRLGVISTPEIVQYRVDEGDLMIVIGSDGV